MARECIALGADHADVAFLKDKLLGTALWTTEFDLPLDVALRAYQSARGLGVDGVAGPATWAALGEEGKSCSSSTSRNVAPSNAVANNDFAVFAEPLYKRTWFKLTVGGFAAALGAYVIWSNTRD